jgi:hypothetical protein
MGCHRLGSRVEEFDLAGDRLTDQETPKKT